MNFLTLAGYQFIELSNLTEYQHQLQNLCSAYQLKGTILLSFEGININLAGNIENITHFKAQLPFLHSAFANFVFHEIPAAKLPYKRLKVKIKAEIITLRKDELDVVKKRAPALTALELKKWIDEKKAFTLLDTRNDYEVAFGSFKNAVDLNIQDFSQFPEACKKVDKQKPVVMFCTGGIRCEKAALTMLAEGYEEVYQLDRGILGYFSQVGGEHYEGNCFVFDERVALTPTLQASGEQQCEQCQKPIYTSQHTC